MRKVQPLYKKLVHGRKLAISLTLSFSAMLILFLVAAPVAMAAVWTDQPDYSPGSTVTLSGDNSDGAGFLPGETIHVDVSGPNGYQASCEAVADTIGAWTCQVILVDNSSAVGDYSYTATGLTSGVSQSSTFKDGTSSAKGTITGIDGVGLSNVNVTCTSGCSGNPLPSAGTDALGNYAFQLTFSGSTTWVTLTASKTGYISQSKSISVASGGGPYRVDITLAVPCVPPVILTAPVGASAVSGDSVNFTVIANGSSPLRYLWRKNGSATGPNANSFTINPVSISDAGSYDVNISNTCGSAVSSPVSLIVTKVAPIITWSNPADIVFGTPLGDAQLNATASVPGSFTYSPSEGTLLNPGSGQTLNVVFIPTDSANYVSASKDVMINILKATPLITWSNPADLVYGTPLSDVQLNAASSIPGSFVYSPALGTILNAGDEQALHVLFTPTDTANYNTASMDVAVHISKVAITVAADPQTMVYGSADPLFTYHITGGVLVNGDTFSGAPGRDTGKDIDTYAITQGTLALSSNYDLNFEGNNLIISARPITVTADPQTRFYGEADPTLTYHLTNGSLAFDDAFSGALTRNAGENTGAYTITQGDLALSNNYALTFEDSNLTITARPITVSADPQAKVYGEADPIATYQITRGSLAFNDGFSGTLSRDPGENAGHYAISQGDLALSSNYALSYQGANLTISARPISVRADPQTKVYGEADPAFTYQVTSGVLLNGDTFSGSLSRDPGQNAGSYAITQGTLALSSNYDLSYGGNNLVISVRPVTVNADPQTKTYGTADPALTYQVTSGSLAFDDAFNGALSRDPGENIGIYAINQGDLTLSNNYALAYQGANLTISVRPIIVSADPQARVYGESDPDLTYQVTSGSLAFDDLFSGALSRDPGEDIGNYGITQGDLTLSNNYALSYEGTNLTISARPITVSADPQTSVYGESDPALTYRVTSGTLAFDDAFTGALSRDPGSNAGSYAITQADLALSANYAIIYESANLTISPRPIAIRAGPQTKVYGEVDPVLTYQVTGGNMLTGDEFTGTLGRDDGEHTGHYNITQGTLAHPNYAVTFEGSSLTISPRPITVTADPQSGLYGQADPAFTYHITSGSLVFNDAFNGTLSREPGQDVGAYAITQGTLGLNLDYILSFNGAQLTISPLTINVIANPISKTYGETDPALTYAITPPLAGGDTFSGALIRGAGENAGQYNIIQGTLALSSNYTLVFTAAQLTISPRTITVSVDAKTKTVNTIDPALTYAFTPALVGSDTFSGALTRVAGENTGTYAILQGTLALPGNYSLIFVGANLSILNSNGGMCNGGPGHIITEPNIRWFQFFHNGESKIRQVPWFRDEWYFDRHSWRGFQFPFNSGLK